MAEESLCFGLKLVVMVRCSSSFLKGGVEQKELESGLAEQADTPDSSSLVSSSLVSSSLVSSSLESSSLVSSSLVSSSLVVDEDVSFTFKPEAVGGRGNVQVIFWVGVA